jgi:hypothetical protein
VRLKDEQKASLEAARVIGSAATDIAAERLREGIAEKCQGKEGEAEQIIEAGASGKAER